MVVSRSPDSRSQRSYARLYSSIFNLLHIIVSVEVRNFLVATCSVLTHVPVPIAGQRNGQEALESHGPGLKP